MYIRYRDTLPAVGGHHSGDGSVGSHETVGFRRLLHFICQGVLWGEGRGGQDGKLGRRSKLEFVTETLGNLNVLYKTYKAV